MRGDLYSKVLEFVAFFIFVIHENVIEECVFKIGEAEGRIEWKTKKAFPIEITEVLKRVTLENCSETKWNLFDWY